MGDAISAIRFDNVIKEYAGGARGVDGVSFEVPRGAFAVIVGPSGCGKTTLLKMVNRLFEPTSGHVFVDGEDVAAVEPTQLRRRIGYVIQQVGLFPHMTVADNVAVVPTLLSWHKSDITARVDELLAIVHLEPPLYRNRYPSQLSGGQQQRVGLARALAADPTILLMDEPFGAVDAIERAHLQEEVATLHARLHKTILFVTHDVDEALRLGDVVIVMRAGRVEQYGAPLRILAHPANDFVAELVDAGDVLRSLSVISVGSAMSALGDGAPVPQVPTIDGSSSLRAALGRMIGASSDLLVVVNDAGAPIGSITLDRIREAASSNSALT